MSPIAGGQVGDITSAPEISLLMYAQIDLHLEHFSRPLVSGLCWIIYHALHRSPVSSTHSFGHSFK